MVYTFGPDYGRRIVTHADLAHLQMHLHTLRQAAIQHLEVLASRAEFHGQPPALMLSFEGLESSLLFANDFWARLEGAVPGELVVGVPARDVVVVTGSKSAPGLEKAKRCVERVFFAGGDNLITRSLLVRRNGTWEPFDRNARPSGRPVFGPAHTPGVGQPPRQYQEHPSWPGERIPAQTGGLRPGPGQPSAVRRRPMPGMSPAALDQTGPQPPVPAVPPGPPPMHVPGPAGPMAPVPEPALRSLPSDVAEVAQYSAVPYSAVPYSAAPYAGAPHSAVPYSAAPYDASAYAIAPQSVAPNAVATGVLGHPGYGYGAPAGYAGEPYTTGSIPRVEGPYTTGSIPRVEEPYTTGSIPRVEEPYTTGSIPRADEPYTTGSIPRVEDRNPAISYPASWGAAPEKTKVRPEFRTGPRARFS